MKIKLFPEFDSLAEGLLGEGANKIFLVGGLFFGGLFGCRAVFRYFPHQLRFGHPLGGFTVNRAFFTIFRQAEGGGRRAVFTRGQLLG